MTSSEHPGSRRSVESSVEASGPRPAVLVVTAVPPDPNGAGVTIRGHHLVRALSIDHDVDLLLAVPRLRYVDLSSRSIAHCRTVRVWSDLPPTVDAVLEWIAGFVLHHVVRPLRWSPRRVVGFVERLKHRRIERAVGLVAPSSFDRIVVCHLGLVALAQRLASARGCRLDFDLDDLDSPLLRRRAALAEAEGDGRLAATLRFGADLADEQVRRVVPTMSRVTVSSDVARRALLQLVPAAEVSILPNVIEAPETAAALRGRSEDEPVQLLFVGLLGYEPNDDALRFFADEIAPQLDVRLGDAGWRLDVVGAGLPAATAAHLAAHPQIVLHGRVEDLADRYERCHVSIAPLRLGVGTRLKIVEAFVHRRPVVCTPVAAEGLDVEDGVHALIRSDPAEFAAACQEAAGVARAQLLTEAAILLHRTRYHPDLLRELVR